MLLDSDQSAHHVHHPLRRTDNRDSTPGPFITSVTQTRHDGHQLVFLSRRHRKQLQPLHLNNNGLRLYPILPRSAWLRFWAPERLAWWIAILFIIGSACFGYSSFASNWPQLLALEITTASAINAIFFTNTFAKN